jgi:cysteine desulfurase family protein (TIGR01976 family)
MKKSPVEVRSRFPALQSGFVFLENAGGSQVPDCVAEAVRRHMLTDYVQLGAGYDRSKRATQMVAEAHDFSAELVNSRESGQTFLGASATSLIHMVANAVRGTLVPGDEIIVAETNHEANAGAWYELEMAGAVVHTWRMDPGTYVCEVEELTKLLSARTKLVAIPHVSNLVGQIEDVEEVAKLAHGVGAKLFVDGVAFAPHRAIDVQALGVDWYVFSVYKVYGPHMAVLYGRHSALEELVGPNHAFIPPTSYPSKWELGGVSHEACAGLLGLKEYFAFLCGTEYLGRMTVKGAFDRMVELEKPVEERFRSWLSQRGDLTVLGSVLSSNRTVGTMSFIHESLSSDRVTAATDRSGIGIRHGNMYAVRILDALNIPRDPGVVRVSAVHYNTVEEIDHLISVLEESLSGSEVG